MFANETHNPLVFPTAGCTVPAIACSGMDNLSRGLYGLFGYSCGCMTSLATLAFYTNPPNNSMTSALLDTASEISWLQYFSP
jgi:hypothetical protein